MRSILRISTSFRTAGDNEQFVRLIGVLVFLSATILVIPSFWIPLGLPPEADAVDYRIPIIKWIIRNREYPNWPWSYVDDFPMLAEVLMVPFYWVSPGLGRLVPLFFHLLAGLAAGGIFFELIRELFPKRNSFRPSTWILIGGACFLCLRPLAIQSNIFLTDTAATSLWLLALWMILLRKPIFSGLAFGLSMATKYFVWPFFIGVFFFHLSRYSRSLWIRVGLQFCLITLCCVLPTLIRNFFVNAGNPFFPLLENIFRPESGNLEPWLDGYGRGKSLFDFFLFPFDLIYTNSFVTQFYDYTVGKGFLFHLILCLILLCSYGKGLTKFLEKFANSRPIVAIIVVIFLNTVIWFLSSQQLRFYTATLVLVDILMMIVVFSRCSYLIPWIALLGIFSLGSIQKDSLLIAFGYRPQQFENDYKNARDCFARIPNLTKGVVGYVGRDNTLGFFDFDFRFVGWHVYGIPGKQYSEGKPDYIFGSIDSSRFEGYQPWPSVNPCVLKLSQGGAVAGVTSN